MAGKFFSAWGKWHLARVGSSKQIEAEALAPWIMEELVIRGEHEGRKYRNPFSMWFHKRGEPGCICDSVGNIFSGAVSQARLSRSSYARHFARCEWLSTILLTSEKDPGESLKVAGLWNGALTIQRLPRKRKNAFADDSGERESGKRARRIYCFLAVSKAQWIFYGICSGFDARVGVHFAMFAFRATLLFAQFFTALCCPVRVSCCEMNSWGFLRSFCGNWNSEFGFEIVLHFFAFVS